MNVIIGCQLIFCDEWAKTALNGAQRVCIRCEQMSAFGYPAHEHGKVKCIEPFAAFCAEVRYNFRGGVAAISRNKVVQCLTRPCEFFRTGAFFKQKSDAFIILNGNINNNGGNISMAKQKEEFVTHIASRTEDFPQWYTDIILKSDMVDYSEVKGCMVIKPYGYAVWELMQHELDTRFKATGHKNAYFPLFIPEHLLQKEKDHVEGFAPEVAWVTQGGEEKLAERLCVRPTL